VGVAARAVLVTPLSGLLARFGKAGTYRYLAAALETLVADGLP
jgi:hypothetical protein